MTPFRATLWFLPLLGLLACGGGRSSPTAASPTPAAPEVFVRDRTTGTPRLLGMGADGSSPVVLVRDATRLSLGLRTSRGLAYGLSGTTYRTQELRLVGLDGTGDRLLRTVDDAQYRLWLTGEVGGHLLLYLQHNDYLHNRVESLPLAGGNAVTWSTQGSPYHIGTASFLYADLGQYRLGQPAAGTSQAYTVNGFVAPLPSGGFLAGSSPANFFTGPLSLLTGDFALVRELAAEGMALPTAGTSQAPDQVMAGTATLVFGQIPNGPGRSLMVFSRADGSGTLLDAASVTGTEFHALGVVGTRLAYRLTVPDAEPGFFKSAYRVVPLTSGPVVELSPLGRRDDGQLLGLTGTSLVEALPGSPNQAVLRFYPLDGATGTEVAAWAPGGARDVQARVVGDRVAYVAFDGATYRLMSVDAGGQGAKVHLESNTPIYGEFLNGTEVAHGRMCFTRGNDLFLLDPTGGAPVLLHMGSAQGYFVGWAAQRVLYGFTEGGDDALWSARLDGTDQRQLTPRGDLLDLR